MDEELVRAEFRAPVWVHVDVEHGEIVSVHVDDLSLDGSVDVCAYSGSPVDQERRKAAIDDVNAHSMWPAWIISFDHA